MMERDPSDSQLWWTLLEVSSPEGRLITFTMVQMARTPREAAMQSAGFQLADNWRPRRITVHPEAPYIYEWTQVRPYIMEVGKEISAP